MIAYRICNSLYKDDVSGTGSKLTGGRWNSVGIPVLYLSEHVSLSVLEMLINNQFKDFAISLSLLIISLPEKIEIAEIKVGKLKDLWQEDFSYTRFMGNEFIKTANTLVLKVPSAVISEENNYLINPLHADFKKIKILKTKSFRTDKRLFTL